MNTLVTPVAHGAYRVNMPMLLNLPALLGPARRHGEPLEQRHKDIARSAQLHLEEIVERLVLETIRATNIRNIAAAGGVFLNVLLNARLSLLPEVQQMFVQPAAHDAGTAIGAGALSVIAHGGEAQVAYDSMFLGTGYSDEQVERYLKLGNITYTKMDNPTQTIARLLGNENVVALYRGRMEFGPRALGNRSILASPCSERTKYKLNELKDREQFRPLAPLVPEEFFDEYFEGIANRYMMFTVKAKNSARLRIPAAVHADGTCRKGQTH
jgi:carbamoyltransferase